MDNLFTIGNEKIVEIIEKLKSRQKGTNVRIVWERDCKTYQHCNDDIRKRSSMVCRIGIDYNNQAEVIEARDQGYLPKDKKPIWGGAGEWVEGCFPYLIRHKYTDKLYLRLYKGTCPNHKADIQYFRNGEPVPFSKIKESLTAKETAPKQGHCFCVKANDVVEIVKKNEELLANPIESSKKKKKSKQTELI